MVHPVKIATCCYCGTRAALVLDKGQHALACCSCGAPLSAFKRLAREHPVKEARHTPAHESASGGHFAGGARKVHGKRRKSAFRKLISEAFDVIDDIFD